MVVVVVVLLLLLVVVVVMVQDKSLEVPHAIFAYGTAWAGLKVGTHMV